jgi:hypothetical protein
MPSIHLPHVVGYLSHTSNIVKRVETIDKARHLFSLSILCNGKVTCVSKTVAWVVMLRGSE